MSSPSWHSSTVVKPGSSTVSSGDTRGGAGGAEQLPQHSPSAEPSARLLASRAKPGWGGPKPSGVPGVKQRSRRRMCAWCSLSVRTAPVLTRSVLSPSASPKPTYAPSSPVSNFLPYVSLNILVCSTPPHSQALESSRISVSFDYRGWMGDVSQA